MAEVSLSAQHLVKRYGGVVALADGSLDVTSGEVLALMGANGSGKSTIGKIITEAVVPDGAGAPGRRGGALLFAPGGPQGGYLCRLSGAQPGP